MTTALEATDAVVKRWIANWTGTTKTDLEGENFTPTRGEAYARLTIRHIVGVQSTQGSTGNRRFRRKAEAIVQLFTPATGGAAAGNALMHTAKNIFEATSFSNLRFIGSAQLAELGVDGEWLMHLVTCPFDYQEIK